MTDRTVPLLLVVLGALTVLFTAALFINVRSATRRGPRWHRRLLLAGLVLLASAQRVRAAKLIGVAQKSIQVMLKAKEPEPEPPIPKRGLRHFCYAPMIERDEDKSGDAGKQRATRVAAAERVVRAGVLNPVVTAKMRARLDRGDSED